MLENLLQLGYGLLLGTLVGVEREKNTIQKNNYGFAGLRSFGLIGLLGSICGYLDNSLITGVVLFGLMAFVIGIYVVANVVRNEKKSGITSEIAVILVFIIGLIAGSGEYFLGTSLAVVLTFLLGWKTYLHTIVGGITKEEFESILKFILIAFIFLPLLPDTAFGPYGSINLYKLWFLVVLISGISGVSYVAVKIIGYKKGLSIGGFIGGLVSSTASTFSFAKMSKDFSAKTENALLTGMMMTSVAMYFRILFQVSVVNSEIFKYIAIPLSTGGLSLLGFAYFFSGQKESKKLTEVENIVSNPFSIINAIKFSLFFALILMVVNISLQVVGEEALYVVSLVSGLVDTDAISLSLATLSQQSLSIRVASYGIVIAAVSNMLAKVGYVWLVGSKSIRLRFLKFILVNVALVGLSVGLVSVVNIFGV